MFSDPEVGAVGLTEAQARARLAQTDIYRAMFKPMKATLSGRDTTVLLKLVVDGVTDRVVGCHVVGEGAAEMIQLAAVAVKMGATKADFDATMALHPTVAEELVTMRTEDRELRPRSGGIGGFSGCRGRAVVYICRRHSGLSGCRRVRDASDRSCYEFGSHYDNDPE